jgi:voltage-gated potassium channel
MKKENLFSNTFWNGILFVSVIFTVFVLPVLPVELHRWLFRTFYSLIFITAMFSLENRSKKMLSIFFAAIFLEWFSLIFDLNLVYDISRGVNIVFFMIIVVMLIRQVATASKVTPGVILGSITGYLLLGLIFSIFVTAIAKYVPDSYSNITQNSDLPGTKTDASAPLYYSYVTIASLGYGDICPLKPLSRSLATVIVVSGQFYMAVIVALLVGKFSSQQGSE